MSPLTKKLFASLWLIAACGLAGAPAWSQPQTSPTSQANSSTLEQPDATGGPVRLRQPATAPARPTMDERSPPPDPQAPPTLRLAGEFELYVQALHGLSASVRRIGAEMVTGSAAEARNGDVTPLVPAEYVIGPGDEVLVTLWGSVDADLRLQVDRSGRISIPRVGAVQVSGLRYGELPEAVNRRVAQVFRNFQSSVSLGQLRGIRVFVTGHVERPGTYTVSSLSTIVGALLRAGGPSASGSFRQIELRRGDALVGRFDLYDLLAKGDRSADRVVQAGDVVHVLPVGIQVGVIGSVNKPAVVELKPGETVADALRYAGGFSAVADRGRLAIERLRDRNAGRVAELSLPGGLTSPLAEGDVLRAFSAVDIRLATQAQSKRVRIEGEVQRPGEYVMPQASTLREAVRMAGGYTTAAYLPAAEFTRETVRARQRENYDRALRDLETDLARASSTRRIATADEAASQQASSAASSRLVDRLRALQPTGRLVLQVTAESTDLPDLALEDGDRLIVPPRPTSVGVFGSVFNAGSYMHNNGRTLGDYLTLAGGPTKGADEGSIFVVRANGQVISSRQQESGWFRRESNIAAVAAEPGDSVFVPEEMDKTTFLQAAKDWTQILYQLGVGAAGIASAVR